MSSADLTTSSDLHELGDVPELGVAPHRRLANLWLKGARGFGRAFWDALGEKHNPVIVFEHPGETTLPSSCFLCETGGMIVICAGTTGDNATLDLRYHWMRQKRLQGSHFANDDQARGARELVTAGKVDPCLSRVFPLAEVRAEPRR